MDSCYDHDVMHDTAGIPPFSSSNCLTDPDCNYELTWTARVFDNLTDESTNVTELECRRIYRCKSVQVVSTLSLKLPLSSVLMFHTHNAHTVVMASQLSAISEHACSRIYRVVY